MNRLTEYRKDLKRYEYKQDERGYCFIQEGQIVNKLGKLEDLEEELGCPLEVRERAIKYGIYIKNIDGEMVNFKVMLVYKNEQLGYYFRIVNDGYVLLTDYKKTWFLKEDKSE